MAIHGELASHALSIATAITFFMVMIWKAD
ncbi:hypothetical protein TIFTF001_052684 [Ficus carica]|uniref:Uncharacterized protein n=1 Tax=Ficus carica TaxID=3494 RepID=A0AA88EBH9_FICCA|nr:hypothetical protein TIFTF001_052684 [Ficus carica]